MYYGNSTTVARARLLQCRQRCFLTEMLNCARSCQCDVERVMHSPSCVAFSAGALVARGQVEPGTQLPVAVVQCCLVGVGRRAQGINHGVIGQGQLTHVFVPSLPIIVVVKVNGLKGFQGRKTTRIMNII
jgi:hypothetical protein